MVAVPVVSMMALAASTMPQTGQGQAFDPYAPTADDTARKQRMVEAWKAFHGKLPEPLKAVRGQKDSAKTNRCKPIVRTGVAFLVGKDLSFTVKPPDTADDDDDDAGGDAGGDTSIAPATVKAAKATKATKASAATPGGKSKLDPATQKQQDWLDACLSGQDSPNDIMALLGDAATNAGVCGHAFIKIQPAGGKDELGDDINASEYPRLVVLDPQNVRMVTDSDDVSTTLAYVVEWKYTDSRTGELVQRRQVTARENRQAKNWTITEQEMRAASNSSRWQTLDEITWDHAWSPIHDTKNLPNPNESWGEPDLEEDIVELNKVLNFIQSNVARIIRFHAHPKTYGRGFDVKQLTVNVDGVLGIPSSDPNAGLFNLEMHGDLSSSLNFAGDIRSDMDELSHVPGVALGRLKDLPKGNLSGVALELLFAPLLQKTEAKRRFWTNLLRQLCAHLLELGGFGAGITMQVNWPQVLPRDENADAQTALVKEQIGVSRRTLVTEMGYDYDEEQENTAEEQQTKVLAVARGQALPPAGLPAPVDGASVGAGGDQPDAPAPGQMPPMMHPAAVQARQAAQAAAGKQPTAGGM